MSFEAFVEQYGYLAVTLGTFFEGETIVIVAGFLAHHGHLSIGVVAIAAFIGAFLGDQLYFYIGRWKGREFVASRPRLDRHSEKVERLLRKHRVWLILGFRFVYGMRTVTPFILGASQLSARLFLALNSIGAIIWAVAISYAGYYFGAALEAVLGRAKQYELYVISVVVGIAAAIWVVRVIAWRYSKSKT